MKSIFLILSMTFLGVYSPTESAFIVTGTVYESGGKNPIQGASIQVKGSAAKAAYTDINGKYEIKVNNEHDVLVAWAKGYKKKETVVGYPPVRPAGKRVINFYLSVDKLVLSEQEQEEKPSMPIVEVPDQSVNYDLSGKAAGVHIKRTAKPGYYQNNTPVYSQEPYLQHNTEEYAAIHENIFMTLPGNLYLRFP